MEVEFFKFFAAPRGPDGKKNAYFRIFLTGVPVLLENKLIIGEMFKNSTGETEAFRKRGRTEKFIGKIFRFLRQKAGRLLTHGLKTSTLRSCMTNLQVVIILLGS